MITPSTTNWVVPERKDLLEVLDVGVVARADGAVTDDAKPDDPVPQPGSGVLRSELVVAKAVRKVRAAIRNAGHTPLSVTPGSVPPEAYEHVLAMAAWWLLNSTPNVQMVVITEKGVYSPMQSAYKDAVEWCDGRIEGGRRSGGVATHAITPPTDPTGRDWETEVTWMADADLYSEEELAELEWTWSEFQALGYTLEEWQAITNPPIRGTVRYGSTERPTDLTADSPQYWPPQVREVLGEP